jgi:hypothetical protein
LGIDPSPLELEDFPPLAEYLRPHVLDLGAEVFKGRHGNALKDPKCGHMRTKTERLNKPLRVMAQL